MRNEERLSRKRNRLKMGPPKGTKYTFECRFCHKMFTTDNPYERLCSADCRYQEDRSEILESYVLEDKLSVSCRSLV